MNTRDHLSSRAVKHAICSFNEAIEVSSSRVILAGIMNNTNHNIITSSYHKKQLEDKYINTNHDNNSRDNNRDRSSSIHEISQQHPMICADMCRPWNYDDFLLRLKTFHSTRHWFAKPSNISPIECALIGWVNTGYICACIIMSCSLSADFISSPMMDYTQIYPPSHYNCLSYIYDLQLPIVHI